MRKLLLASLLIFLVPVFALAQDNNRVNQGYAFWGLGDSYGTSAMHFGGGIDYWFANRYGLKVEFRDHILTDCSYDCHAYQIRTGLSFR